MSFRYGPADPGSMRGCRAWGPDGPPDLQVWSPTSRRRSV